MSEKWGGVWWDEGGMAAIRESRQGNTNRKHQVSRLNEKKWDALM